MPPKFQSTFIPSGPAATSVRPPVPGAARRKHVDLFSFLSGTIFFLSVLFALGVFGYKYFLNYQIEQMGAELESARAAIDPETVTELIKLNSRIVSTQNLINSHLVLTPIFEFLESSTPETVRYSQFAFTVLPQGLSLELRGQAESYGALAAASEIFNDSDLNFKNPTFSELRLDAEGNVIFSLQLGIEAPVLSFELLVKSLTAPVIQTASSTTSTVPTTSASTVPNGAI